MSSGITLPSTSAQEALIRQTYAGAGLPLDETSFFEAHGTGDYSASSEFLLHQELN